MRCLNDHWTLDVGQLGYDGFARQLKEIILAAPTPVAITVGGRWGMGKTSMLRAVMAALGGRCADDGDAQAGALPESLDPEEDERLRHVWPVWFNPWQYQHEDSPLVPLLHEVREHVQLQAKLAEGAKEVAKDAFELALHNFGRLMDTAANLFIGKRIVDLGTSMTEQIRAREARRARDTFAEPVDAQRFFQVFEKAVEGVTGASGQGRLVVFVDDLDRCSDQTVFALLEQIKLYLASRRCVFVFGLDRTHVENAVARAARYNVDEARQYVEKLFQARLYLPQPDEKALARFVRAQLKLLKLPSEPFLKSLVAYLPPNPRTVKNTLNGLPLYRAMLAREHRNDERCLLMYLFRSFHPDAYELLLHSPADVLAALNQKVFLGELDRESGMQAYLHYVTANPTMRVQPPDTPAMDETRFHQVRAGAWQAEALKRFHERFQEVFRDSKSLEGFLI